MVINIFFLLRSFPWPINNFCSTLSFTIESYPLSFDRGDFSVLILLQSVRVSRKRFYAEKIKDLETGRAIREKGWKGKKESVVYAPGMVYNQFVLYKTASQ